LDNYHEFLLANTVFWALAEGFASEFSDRRTAMENATKNADEMVKKLTLTYNRSRQAVITNELWYVFVSLCMAWLSYLSTLYF
jgi:F-type H+-transporting ATPase subunit gamma